ncbi:MAG: protein-tyrosine-phosphatase [Hyphomicrobiales bacterium]|nr:protein-tyrosine-phosphatase [Hyphomicrobiales bacterium]
MKPFLFSTLTICGLEELGGHSARGVTHVLSILDPGWPEPAAFDAFGPHVRATFRFHDMIEPAPGALLPQKADVAAILAFARDAGDISHLLIHCHAGISRSTASMLMILAQAHPRESERQAADRLVRIRPQAWPNSRMVSFADELLGRGGRLMAALAPLYARRLKAQPELAEAMRLGGRGREVEMGLAA